MKDHYGIADIRTGLREYQLGNVSTDISKEQVIAQHEIEVERLRGLTCPYCEVRKYYGNRFDRCYWCHRIVKDGLMEALADYLSEDIPWERTGDSMYKAHHRMVDRGEIPITEAPAIIQEQKRSGSKKQTEKKPYWKLWLWGAAIAIWVVLIVWLFS